MTKGSEDGWIILRTGASRTLKLAASLAEASVETWTPTEQVTRLGRGKKRNDKVTLSAPITPTFVFARADRLADLLIIIKLPVSPHPQFSILRHDDRIPVVSERSLTPLRQAEAKAVPKEKRADLTGYGVHPQSGAWAGMKGKVIGERGKDAIVDFGGGFEVAIASYLLVGDVLRPPPQSEMGIAA